MMVKEKEESTRIYDNEGYKKRAACVCVKNESESEVLLISSSRKSNCWIIPGGGIESDENPEDAAEREVYEEAGVSGRLGRLLGVFENKERKHRTSVYLLIVDKEFDEWDEHKKLGRTRKWFNLEDAKSELDKHKPIQGSYLNLLKGFEHVSSFYNKTNNSFNHFTFNQTNNTANLVTKNDLGERSSNNSKETSSSNNGLLESNSPKLNSTTPLSLPLLKSDHNNLTNNTHHFQHIFSKNSKPSTDDNLIKSTSLKKTNATRYP